jgi:hypothetical protein
VTPEGQTYIDNQIAAHNKKVALRMIIAEGSILSAQSPVFRAQVESLQFAVLNQLGKQAGVASAASSAGYLARQDSEGRVKNLVDQANRLRDGLVEAFGNSANANYRPTISGYILEATDLVEEANRLRVGNPSVQERNNLQSQINELIRKAGKLPVRVNLRPTPDALFPAYQVK